jgi:CRP-like cAMP-binding protein
MPSVGAARQEEAGLSTAQAHFELPSLLELRPDLRRFWDGTLPMELPRGDYLYLPGDPPRSVFLIRAGVVRVARLLDSGGELTVHIAGPGELVGERAVLGEMRRPGLAQALDRVKVSPLPVPILEAAALRHPELGLALARMAAERSSRFEARATLNAFADCHRRVCSVLLELAGRFGRREGRGWSIGVRLTHEELARLIGATRETVTPLLVNMRRDGLIDYDRRRIQVLDRDALERALGRPAA